MSTDAQKLWEYIEDCLNGDSRNELIISIQRLEENRIEITKEKAERLLGELKADGLLEAYSVEEDDKISVSLKTESTDEVQNKSESEETVEHSTGTSEVVDDLYHINKEFIESLQQSHDLTEAKLQYYRLSGDIRDILQVAGHNMIIAQDDLLRGILSGIHKKIYYIDDEGEAEAKSVVAIRAFFITGNGGVGKTTLLVMAALYMACNTDTDVYVVQFKVNGEKDYARRIIDYVSKGQDVILFIDNPYDNVDATRYLVDYVRWNKNIRIVFSERHNRLELIFKDAALLSIVNIAGAIIIENQKQMEGGNPYSESLHFVRKENTEVFVLSKSWKREVVEKMIFHIMSEDMKSEDERLQKILNKADYTVSPCETLLQVCLQYNREVEEERLEMKIPFQFDWDEWKSRFSIGTEHALRAEGISLENVFPFIAALGLYKIPVTVKFIANLVKVNELELRDYFDKKLHGTEPVCYDGELLSLKHDMIADLYFHVCRREREPQYYLMEAINYLDESLILKYERYVLSAKIIRGKREIPHSSIDTVALFKDFEKHETYIRCLIDHGRFYSYRHAKIYIVTQENHSNEEEFQREWSCLLQEVPDEEKHQFTIWYNCFTACMEMNFFPPDNFFSAIEYVDYRVVTDKMSSLKNYVLNRGYDIYLYRRIARKTYQVIAEKYEKDIPSRLALAEIMVEQSAVKDAEKLLKDTLDQDIEDKYKICIEYATLCKKRFMKLNKKIWKINKKRKERNDVNYNRAKHVNVRFLSQQKEEATDEADGVRDDQVKTEDKPRKLSIYQQRKYYLESAEQYYRLALELVEGEEDARPFCAFASFLQSTAGISCNDRGNRGIGDMNKLKANRLEESKKYFFRALEIGGSDFSAYNGLAMIYAQVQKWNPCFNPVEADRCYEKAVETCPKNMRVSCYVPWGNLNYNIGKLEKAKEKYENALAYKPDEIRAIMGLKLIEEEQQKLDQLILEKPKKIKNFGQLYRKRKKKPLYVDSKRKKRRNIKNMRWTTMLNQDLFKEETMKREILRLVYVALRSEEITPEILKKCKKAMTNLSCIGGIGAGEDEIGFLYLRIAQCLQICCDQYSEEPYLDLGRQKTFAHMMFVRYKKVIIG